MAFRLSFFPLHMVFHQITDQRVGVCYARIGAGVFHKFGKYVHSSFPPLKTDLLLSKNIIFVFGPDSYMTLQPLYLVSGRSQFSIFQLPFAGMFHK